MHVYLAYGHAEIVLQHATDIYALLLDFPFET